MSIYLLIYKFLYIIQVRPEEVLEKALLMVQNSQKNYLYKCDQLKSIRQDLTVQRIHNQLTVKVYLILLSLSAWVYDALRYSTYLNVYM